MKGEEKKYKNNENGEDATQYGEFISSYFSWITLDDQKKRAEELNENTKNKEKQQNNEKE